MEEPKREVKLYGAWESAHAAMARNTLELKGVRYEYVEENLERKSEALLRLNPVHGGKVPVFVVDGRPLAESPVILEYIDEACPDRAPPLLPPRDRPHARAAARFWVRFWYDKVSPLSQPLLFAGEGEERAGAAGLVREIREQMAVMEAGIQADFPLVEGPFLQGPEPGLLDVILGSCAAGTRVLSDMIGEEIVEPGVLPRVHASMVAFDEPAAGFGTSAPHERLLASLVERKERRERGTPA